MNRPSRPRRCTTALLFMFAMGLSAELPAQPTDQTSTLAEQTQTTPANSGAAATAPENPPPTPTPAGTSAAPEAATKPQPVAKPQVPKDDRIFFALPNYATVENAASLPPLTTRQKFKMVAEGCFDPVEAAFTGIQAGIGQADNTNPTYGQGLIGYSKRYGTSYADAIIGNFGTGAIFPALLHQDPRYYQMGKGNGFHRAEHAALRILITRSDSGKTQFNFSEFLGNGVAAGLSNAYHPGPHTLIGSTNVLETQLLLDGLGYELKEFWPDIHRLLRRH